MSIAVFPAPAGVIPYLVSVFEPALRFPRTCGGDPTVRAVCSVSTEFSPHLRG